jgi:hypothetical protein
MDEFRLWWASAVRGFLAWLVNVWNRIAYGLMHEWQVTWFVAALGVILITGMFVVWRRKA